MFPFKKEKLCSFPNGIAIEVTNDVTSRDSSLFDGLQIPCTRNSKLSDFAVTYFYKMKSSTQFMPL
jgi:hypothetical protein